MSDITNEVSIECLTNPDRTAVSIHIMARNSLTLQEVSDILKQYAEGIQQFANNEVKSED
jgi:hypothetical protein